MNIPIATHYCGHHIIYTTFVTTYCGKCDVNFVYLIKWPHIQIMQIWNCVTCLSVLDKGTTYFRDLRYQVHSATGYNNNNTNVQFGFTNLLLIIHSDSDSVAVVGRLGNADVRHSYGTWLVVGYKQVPLRQQRALSFTCLVWWQQQKQDRPLHVNVASTEPRRVSAAIFVL